MKFKMWLKTILLLAAGSCFAVETSADVAVKYGESVEVNAFYKGDGKLQFGIIELDASGKELGKVMKTYYGRKTADSRTFVAVVQNPKTVKARATYQIDPKASINLTHVKLAHVDREHTKLYSVKENRKVWFERTKGTNLIAGKKLSFSPSTKSYALTYRGGTDETDLTDGKFARDDDQIWFDKRAVSWSDLKLNLSIIADLGSVQPVEKAVIRICGGRITARERYSYFPPVLEAWISKDGTNYYLARRLTLLGEAEKHSCDWKTLYYLPQQVGGSMSYVYPFELTIQADARYVVIRSPKQHHMTTDEMAVIKAEKKGAGYNQPYKTASVPLFHTSAILKPYYEKFYVADNVMLPNLLNMEYNRPAKKTPFTYEIDLPEQITLYKDKNPPWPASITRIDRGSKTANGRTAFTFEINAKGLSNLPYYLRYGLGPFYFKAQSKVPANQMYVVFRTYEAGKLLFTNKMPLEILHVPQVPQMKRLSVGPAFFYERYLEPWPDFFKTMRHIGFNTLPHGITVWNPHQYKKYYEQGRKEGFIFRNQGSPSPWMMLLAEKEKADVNAMKCQYPGGEKDHLNRLCPSYRGEYYQRVVKMVEDLQKQYPSEYLSFDDECWCHALACDTFTKCSRCDALRKKMGMEWKDFVVWVQADCLSGFYKAAKRANQKTQIGFYDVQPQHIIYNAKLGSIGFNGYDILYPKYCNELQPSNYSDNTLAIHNQTRASYLASGRRPALVHRWLSAGIGAYNSENYGVAAEHEVLESFMNGASGIQYYHYQSFCSPRDYNYVAKALKLIAPFEDIIMDGSMDEKFTGSNKAMIYTIRTLKDKSLVLVGNYHALKQNTTVLPLKGNVTDLVTGEKKTAKGKYVCTVMPDSYAFLLVEK